MTERNVKKQLLREAEDLLDSKKESLTAFYQPTEQKRTRTFRARRTVLAAVSAVLVAAVLLAVPALQNADPSVSNETSAESSATAPSEGESEDDEWWNESEGGVMVPGYPHIGPLQMVNGMTAAIVEITGIEEEDDINLLCKGYTTRLYCKILYYKDSAFVPFQNSDSILVSEGSADDLVVGDILFFEARMLNEYDSDRENWEFAPERNQGKSTFIRFTDGKLVFEEDELKWFGALREYNRWIDMSSDLVKEHSEGHHDDSIYGEQMRFNSGMTVEEVIAYFHEVKRLREEAQKRLQERREESGMGFGFE